MSNFKEKADYRDVQLGEVSPNLYGTIAYRVADDLDYGKNGKFNASTQLRRFYDEMVMWNDRVQFAQEPDQKFKEVAPFVQMIRAKVAYAYGRKLIDDNFKTLMNRLLDQVISAKTLGQAKLFFEAVMGFKKGLEK